MTNHKYWTVVEYVVRVNEKNIDSVPNSGYIGNEELKQITLLLSSEVGYIVVC